MGDEHYLYAIVRDPKPAWRPPAAGIDGAPVASRPMGDLLLVESRLAAAPPPGPRRLGAHHDVVASAIDADALLPFRYGTVVADGALDTWMAERRAAVDQALERLRGHVEMSVKLLRLDGDGDPDEPALRALADRLVDCARLPHWRRRPAGVAGNVVGGVAFLVRRDELSTFLARIAPVASRARGVAVVPTGPWPAYSFVPPLERRPLARLATPPATAPRLAGGGGLV